MSLRIKKNDTVYVRSGADRGKTGRVLLVDADKGKALVEGVNIKRKHERAQGQGKPGGIISKEAPVPVSRLMLVDPKTNRGGRFRVEERDGKKVRVMIKTGNVV